MKWIKDGITAMLEVRRARKNGFHGAIGLVEEETQAAWEQYVKDIQRSYKLAYACIEAMGEGKSRCAFCIMHEDCHSKKKGTMRGCHEWALAFPEVEHEDQA